MQTRTDHTATVTIEHSELVERARSMARPLIAKALGIDIDKVTDDMMEVGLRVVPSSTGGTPGSFSFWVRASKPSKEN